MARDGAVTTKILAAEKKALFDEYERYILSDFQYKKPFSSFLPGIAGLRGIPMWVFYVNRGQAICSFGVEDKDHPILEFQSANKAYQSTNLIGFRTFLKGKRGDQDWYREPFSLWQKGSVKQSMFIGMNELEIQEVNKELGYQINVLYFNLPNMSLPGLVRSVNIKNLHESPLTLEILDGLPNIIPYGIDNGALKNIGRTIEAWMQVENLEKNLPYYQLKASPGDTTEIQSIRSGNFAFSFSEKGLLSAFVDPTVVFGMDTGLFKPINFIHGGLKGIQALTQTVEGRTPCAFFGSQMLIDPGERRNITSIYGFASSQEKLAAIVPILQSQILMDQKHTEARNLTLELTNPIQTQSASPLFDAYCRHTFLDNLVRGGWPLILGEKTVYHVYSRKHGDIERDYNHFVLSPTYYSQGNGNYRDVNQNRRNDVYFQPGSGETNIRLFMSLIQPDGYNPLVVKGLRFSLTDKHLQEILSKYRLDQAICILLQNQFTPGELLEVLCSSKEQLPVEEIIDQVFLLAETHIEAEHGEGFWIDHWTYNLDLIETYLAIFPEEKNRLLFDSDPLPFFDNIFCVQPRSKRYVLSGGKPRQSNAVIKDADKARLIQSRTHNHHWVRTEKGHGVIFRVPLISKFILLAFVKFATLDPEGMGIQMEADRPGWYDALNGLPAVFGSSMPETYELLRLVRFLTETLEETPRPVSLPVELEKLISALEAVFKPELDVYQAWDKRSAALEDYRESVKMGFSGKINSINVLQPLRRIQQVLEHGIKKADDLGEIPPTYLTFSVEGYSETGTYDEEGRPHIIAKAFQVQPLPTFLEGPVRQMKILKKKQIFDLHTRVRQSSLFDEELLMYRVNSSLLNQSHEIGRARAFTPGWLENQSIWMHMAFKYLLELLKADQYQQFFDSFRAHIPAFMNPDVYGRSPLENVSFIASSVHPDPALHGSGFVARLSGSTAEFINMWCVMTAGKQPFRMENGKLTLEIKPVLPGWLFTEEGYFTFQFLGSCKVTLHNPLRKDTYLEEAVVSRTIIRSESETITIEGAVISNPNAQRVRDGEIVSIDMFYE